MRVNRIGLAALLLVASLAAAGAPLKFLTFNIWGDYFGNPVEERAAGVEATILKGHPDVVALQEVTPGWYGSALFANLGKAGYALVRGDEDAALKRAAFCGEKTPKHINHEPLLYRTDRLKLLDSGTDFFHLSLTTSKSVTWAVLERTSDGRRFAAFATHFWWKGNGEESDAIRELNARHVLRVLADIRRKWGADLPAILGGDLNSAAYDTPAHSIDHIFYTKGIHALRHEIITDQTALDVSDHSPVLVAFELVADDIYVVVGYRKEQFKPLPKKYPNVSLIENPDYCTKNNIGSIAVAAEQMASNGNC